MQANALQTSTCPNSLLQSQGIFNRVCSETVASNLVLQILGGKKKRLKPNFSLHQLWTNRFWLGKQKLKPNCSEGNANISSRACPEAVETTFILCWAGEALWPNCMEGMQPSKYLPVQCHHFIIRASVIKRAVRLLQQPQT